jgi:hypothetical protein
LQTLIAVADRLAGAAAPWWIIGSAAAALHGLEIAKIGDVDVLAGIADAHRLLSVPDAVPIDDGGNDIFRSDAFVRLTGLPLKVEILGGLRVRGKPLTITTRVTIPVGKTPVYVPSREELVRIFRLFGRPKDMARAEVLAALG